MLENAEPNNRNSNLSLQEKLVSVEALNKSFEDDFENTSNMFWTIDRLSETENQFPADFPSETIIECSGSEKS